MKMPNNLYIANIIHPFLKYWLSATACSDCYVRRKVVFENNTHIILHHYSHASYSGRFSDNNTCAAYQKLYLKSDLFNINGKPTVSLIQGDKELIRWDGRLNKSRLLDDCSANGIIFFNQEIKQFSFYNNGYP